ncbi:hypothetical protein CROQUDRAFT_668620 [Cronartium quercuum f. sp. fusiforme G11]|uniref:histone deacetylase n=1 Tax=Cronartium quercuum f. sp. fusiforme G11 TaxID=708437 RepID=A0A9P6TF60_9BASI|nr:hypothetical protein CROQUDRAFT_668620 [Cronartium quercuum f. sp. fusiforme G11]
MPSHSDRSLNKSINGISVAKSNSFQPPATAQRLSRFGRSQLTGLPTGICHSKAMLKHWKPDVDFDHENDDDDDDEEPERPSRITRIMAQVSKEQLTPHLEHIRIRKAVKEEIMLVHSEGHWNRIKETAAMSMQDLKDRAAYYSRLSLFVNAETFDCARLSCGGVIEMCRAVVEGRIRNGFAVVRPPGHHSEPEDPSGFCIFNNAAVSAKWLRTIYPDKIRRILLIDWDRSFYHDSSVLYISIHRFLENKRTSYFYPGSDWGASSRVGEGDGRGFNVNIPWPEAGMGDEDYIYAFQRLVMPIALEFNPDFVIVSAGFDAAKNDPLGECDVSPEGFALMTHMLSSLANGNLVLALEGGYHLESTALSATECIKVLMGETPPNFNRALVASEAATETVNECLKVQAEFWKSLPRGLSTHDESTMHSLNIPISEILSMHRSYDLHHAHNLCIIPLQDTSVAAYHNRVMVSENVYECETLVLFLHDLGNIRNELSLQATTFKEEKETLLDTNNRIMNWVTQHKHGVVDVQVVYSTTSDLAAEGLAKKVEQKKAVRRLVQWLWNQFITLADCQNLVLICVGEACTTLPELLLIKAIRDKLKASVYIPNINQIPPVKLNSDNDWYHSISMAVLPQGHRACVPHTTAPDILLHGCKQVSEHKQPSRILKHEWHQIAKFILSTVPPSSLSDTPNGQLTATGMNIDEPAGGTDRSRVIIENSIPF